MYKETFKETIRKEAALTGTWQRIASPVISEVLALSGFDFVTIDMEHGAFDISDLRRLLPVYRGYRVPTVVRVAPREFSLIPKVLDMGANGIMVPQINDAAEARSVVEASKFAPLGARGLGGFFPADEYGELPSRIFSEKANEQVVTIVQIETRQALEQLEEIVAVEGIDLFFIGPFDLSHALGVTGQMDHPLLTETIQRIVRTVRGKGKPVGMHGVSPDFIRYWRERGVGYFTYGLDTLYLKAGARLAKEEADVKQ